MLFTLTAAGNELSVTSRHIKPFFNSKSSSSCDLLMGILDEYSAVREEKRN